MNYYATSFWSPTDIAHYGILGMRWGVRRYQNKDGTLTSEGKKRVEARTHNKTISYRVGEKRINNRLSNLEKQTRKDAASIFKDRQARIGSSEILRKANQEILDNPQRLSDLGKRTIIGRTLATTMSSITGIGAGYLATITSGTSVLSAAATMPIVALPIAVIGTGLYWMMSKD